MPIHLQAVSGCFYPIVMAESSHGNRDCMALRASNFYDLILYRKILAHRWKVHGEPQRIWCSVFSVSGSKG